MKTWKKVLALFLMLGSIGLIVYTAIWGFPGMDGKGKAANIKRGLDLMGGVSITYQTVGEVTPEELSVVVNKMQQRVEDFDGAQVYDNKVNRVTIEIPGEDNADEILKELGRPGSIYFILEYTTDGKTANYKWNKDKGIYELARSLEEIEKDGCVVVTGNDIKSANAGYQTSQTVTQAKEAVVEFRLKDEGTKRFADATALASGKNWTIGIYYDGEFISVPKVSTTITEGSGVISGMGSIEDAKLLASNIKIGAMPVELEEVSSQVVGATLGREAIKTSVIGAAIGFAVLFIFMIVVYRVPGIAADIALIVYTALMLIILNVYNLTLTLPGIAGIVLSVGMAVDANVIIFSRIKEELAESDDVREAIRNGFKKALSAIMDGNITTLIAAIILGVFGSGPVRGFAITHGIGILLSMISSLIVARWILLIMYHLGLNKKSMYGGTKNVKNINFTSKRKLFMGISGAVIAVGALFMIINGATGKGAFKLDLDFSGGTVTTVTFNEDYSMDEIEEKIVPLIKETTGVTTVQQQKVKGSNTVVFKTQMLEATERTKLNEALEKEFGIDTSDNSVVSSENVSATVSKEMRNDAIIAVAIAVAAMLLYIFIRFRDFKFALSAIIALMHDVGIVIAFYAISRIDVGSTFIAVTLTILGYSINATIVIFDRIRENLNNEAMQKATLSDVVNNAVSATLTRSIYTSVTTFIMILALFIVGVDSIKEFAAPIMVGIVAGGYSSICISGALWFVMKKASIKRMMKALEE